jgi:excisionase family DNA binding protein
MEAKEEKRTIQDSPSHDAHYAAWLSAAEAAAYLNFKTRTIQLWARQGRLKAYALAGSQRHVWRFLRSDLDEIVMHRRAVLSSAQPSVLANERR